MQPENIHEVPRLSSSGLFDMWDPVNLPCCFFFAVRGLNHPILLLKMKHLSFLWAGRCAFIGMMISTALWFLLQVSPCTSPPTISTSFCKTTLITLQPHISKPVTLLWPKTQTPVMKAFGHSLGKEKLGTCPMLSVYRNFFYWRPLWTPFNVFGLGWFILLVFVFTWAPVVA